MENKKQTLKKSTLVLILVGVLGVVSIIYAALSTTLTIQSGESTVVDPWLIQFDTTNTGTRTPYKSTELINGFYVADTGDETVYDTKYNNATGGTVTVTNASKTADTVTIKDTRLHDYGAVVIYHLKVLNKGTKIGYLQDYPAITRETSANSDIEIEIYSDANCTTKIAKNNQIAAKSGSTDGSVDWYVKVSYKGYTNGTPSAGTGKNDGTTSTPFPNVVTDFSFSFSPVWSANEAA